MNNRNDWQYVNIGEHLKLLSGFPFSSDMFSSEGGFPLIRIRDVLGSTIETYYQGVVMAQYVVKHGDILIGMDGDFNVSKWKNIDALLNQRVLKVDVNDPDKLDINFIYYWLKPYIYKINEITAATTVKHLSTKDLANAKGRIPGLKTQRRISRILQTIDQVIEKTETLIDKYQKIKAGLMQDLFTRGISPDGKLRPPREKAPDLYQDTPMGWIPKEWVFGACEDVCEKVIDCKNRTPPISPEGHPVIRTPNVRDGQFVDEGLVYTNDLSYLIWTARGAPRPGDIVITREAPVGEVCKIPDRYQHACLGQRMMLYRVDPEKIVADYFLYVLQSNAVKTRLELISGGSTVGHVRVGDIRTLWIFYPKSRAEQLRIASALNYISSKLESEEESLRKLNNQKSGLMYDLLAGKVPVKIEQETQTQPVAMVSA